MLMLILFPRIGVPSFGISQAQAERHSEIIKIIFLGILIGLGSFFLYACVPTSKAVRSSQSNLFRSENYFVYVLQDNACSTGGIIFGRKR